MSRAVSFTDIRQDAYEKFFTELRARDAKGDDPLPVYLRKSVQAALAAGWLAGEYAEVQPDDVMQWKPGEIRRVGEAVAAKSNELSEVPKN